MTGETCSLESAIRGYHVYRSSLVDSSNSGGQERNKTILFDRYAVAILLNNEVIGHVPSRTYAA